MPNPISDRQLLDSILPFLDVPDLPEELRREITLAHEEYNERSEITYPTEARIKYYIHQYSDFLKSLNDRDS